MYEMQEEWWAKKKSKHKAKEIIKCVIIGISKNKDREILMPHSLITMQLSWK